MELWLSKQCSCGWEQLRRIRRNFWMRLFESRRLYVCNGCHARVFGSKHGIEGSPLWADAQFKVFVKKTLGAASAAGR